MLFYSLTRFSFVYCSKCITIKFIYVEIEFLCHHAVTLCLDQLPCPLRLHPHVLLEIHELLLLLPYLLHNLLLHLLQIPKSILLFLNPHKNQCFEAPHDHIIDLTKLLNNLRMFEIKHYLYKLFQMQHVLFCCLLKQPTQIIIFFHKISHLELSAWILTN